MPPVIILLSTYNGQLYLSAQLDSLLEQDYVNFSLWIRDDGSQDATLAILDEYALRHAKIHLIRGENIGVIASFFELLKSCPVSTGSFYAFCDQDDVWQRDKISRALQKLQNCSDPATSLYCSRLRYVDRHLNPLADSAIPRYYGFENALVENIAIGCTQVFGGRLRELALACDTKQLMMHDWWFYLLASAFGEIVYDEAAHILYRQHASNTVGWNKRLPQMLKKSRGFLKNLLINRQGLQCLQQARHFIDCYPDCDTQKIRIIEGLLNLRQSGKLFDRWQFLRAHKIHRNHLLEDLILQLSILLNLH